MLHYHRMRSLSSRCLSDGHQRWHPFPIFQFVLRLSPVKPLKLAKATALAFTLGALLSVGSSPAITRQVEAIAQAQAQAIASSAMQKVLKVISMQFLTIHGEI
jgi:hypothetical protein